MEKRVKFLRITIILTDENLFFTDKDGEKISIIEEKGWWDDKNRIWIYVDRLKWYEKMGILIHEVSEKIFERKVGLKHKIAHKLANIIEKVLTAGKSKTY